MSRLFALVLILLVPFQLAWAGASTYCQHEERPQHGYHFGHHRHAQQDEEQQKVSGLLGVDMDCISCHAVGSVGLLPSLLAPEHLIVHLAPAPVQKLRFTSALSRAPDRPQWLRLV